MFTLQLNSDFFYFYFFSSFPHLYVTCMFCRLYINFWLLQCNQWANGAIYSAAARTDAAANLSVCQISILRVKCLHLPPAEECTRAIDWDFMKCYHWTKKQPQAVQESNRPCIQFIVLICVFEYFSASFGWEPGWTLDQWWTVRASKALHVGFLALKVHSKIEASHGPFYHCQTWMYLVILQCVRHLWWQTTKCYSWAFYIHYVWKLHGISIPSNFPCV